MARRLSRILLVEDDADILRVAALALRRLGGFQVEACASGQEALAVARAFRPDVVLLDVMMAAMDGPAVLKALRDFPETKTTPVIFLTARVQPRDIAAYRAMGCVDVIVKPFVPSALPHLVRGAWSRALEPKPAPAPEPTDDFSDLRRLYLDELPERIAAVTRAADHVRAAPGERAPLEALGILAHRLAGSAAIYGLPALSVAAADLDDLAIALLEEFQGLSAVDLRLIGTLVATMGQAAARPRPRPAGKV
jgi:CheY-like chemotaxis protein